MLEIRLFCKRRGHALRVAQKDTGFASKPGLDFKLQVVVFNYLLEIPLSPPLA